MLRGFSWANLAAGRHEDALQFVCDCGNAAERSGRHHVAEATVVLAVARLSTVQLDTAYTAPQTRRSTLRGARHARRWTGPESLTTRG